MADITTTVRDISELTTTAQKACRLFLSACRSAGYDIFLTETYRSKERQEYLYSLGRTRPGRIVTWTKNSRHISRRAWDIATHGANLYDETILSRCGTIAARFGIIWGGNWGTPDTPHFEINTSWKPPENQGNEEEIDMEELNALTEKVGFIDATVTRLHAKVSDIDASLSNLYNIVQTLVDDKRIYNTIDEVPEWARPTIRKLADANILEGDGGGLALDYNTIRMLVVLDRANVLK